MKSDEVLKNAITPIGAKSIAADMNLSTSLIYKWCQSKQYNEGAADNPLDRLGMLYELTGDDAIVRWLCAKANGYFVKNSELDNVKDSSLINATQEILTEFSELLAAISKSAADSSITARESEDIRQEWEDLKSIAEKFVKACEDGLFTKED